MYSFFLEGGARTFSLPLNRLLTLPGQPFLPPLPGSIAIQKHNLTHLFKKSVITTSSSLYLYESPVHNSIIVLKNYTVLARLSPTRIDHKILEGRSLSFTSVSLKFIKMPSTVGNDELNKWKTTKQNKTKRGNRQLENLFRKLFKRAEEKKSSS